MKLGIVHYRWPSLNFCLAFAAFLTSFLLISDVKAASSQNCLGPADGPGVWMNIWNYPDSTHVEPFCAELAAHGVRNCFVQTSRSNTDAIAHPAELNLLTQTCHRHGIRVIAWSFTQLNNPQADAERLLAAARFRTSTGQSLDGIASDMESNLTPANINSLGQALRSALGPSYPLIAIVYSPLNHSPDAATTPWKLLTKHFDIIAPMTYWSGKKQTLDVYTYTCSTIKQIRQAIGKSDVEIQPIGDAMYSKPDEVVLFMKACRENEATGISIYPNQKLTSSQLACLDKYGSYFPPNARFRLAAYKQLCSIGVMPEPPHGDPSSYMSRGRFYQVLVSQAVAHAAAQANAQHKDGAVYQLLSEADSYKYLEARSAVPAMKDPSNSRQFLDSPIGASEALSTVAGLVNKKRPSSLMQSAKAAESSTTVAASKQSLRTNLLNYVEAAQLIAQARAGFH
jgi:hypothetical protein